MQTYDRACWFPTPNGDIGKRTNESKCHYLPVYEASVTVEWKYRGLAVRDLMESV